MKLQIQTNVLKSISSPFLYDFIYVTTKYDQLRKMLILPSLNLALGKQIILEGLFKEPTFQLIF